MGIIVIETDINSPKQMHMNVQYEASITKLLILINIGFPFLKITAGRMNGT